MNKMRNKVNLDKTISYTQSSFTYKDPYDPNRNIFLKFKNKFSNFFMIRNIENEFIDFKVHNLEKQFNEIYGDLHAAYRRGDKVILQRSLSEPMFDYVKALLKEKRPSPFFRQVTDMKLVQARNYAETDHLLPEEQWAQITFKYNVKNSEDPQEVAVTQYNVFERRLADKLSYLDWKLSYIIDQDDFTFIHAIPTKVVVPETAVAAESQQLHRDIKEQSSV